MHAAADDNRLADFAEPAPQIQIVCEAVQSENAIEVAARRSGRQAIGLTAGGDKQRVVAKAAPALQTEILALRVDRFDVGLDDMDTLLPFGACRIGQQLLSLQLARRELLERGR